MERSEGNMSLKNPVTPPGIDPGTIRLVAQRLNHYVTPGLQYIRIYMKQRCEFCGTTISNSTGCTVNCDRLRGSEGGSWLWKYLIGKWGATAESHCTTARSKSHWRSAINGLELVCRNCSYLYRFNCTSAYLL